MARPSNTDRQIRLLQKLTQGAAAHMAGLSERHIRTTDCPRNSDGTYSARDVAAWLAERSADASDELAGKESPNLERYRAAKADLAEMMAAERRGLLIPRDKNREFLGRVAATIRQASEVIRTFSAEAHQILDEALADSEATIEEFFSDGTA
jgi:phage terminase Nu1 subunit (DNA packaging protein)